MSTAPIFRKAEKKDIATIQQIAAATWPVAYAEILSSRQVHYMMNMMYSQPVLRSQMQQPYSYFYLLEEENGKPAGFFHISATDDEGKWKLHKIYLHPAQHGKKYGKMMLQEAMKKAKENGATSLDLQVNRDNNAQHFYQKNGFRITDTGDFAIGAGFYMNDYVMSRLL